MKITRRFFGDDKVELILDESLRGSHTNNPKISFGPDESVKIIFENDPELSSEHSEFIEITIDADDLRELKWLYDFGLV